MLITFVVLYLIASVAIGLFAAKRVKNTADYAVAGRSLALPVVIATTFATWFGSETVLGVSARFVSGGLGAVVEDPFGASMCLILVGLFFAYKLYQKNLITLGDYYRQRFGRNIEVICSVIIVLSYLGWVAAQVTALGLVFNLLTQGAISDPGGHGHRHFGGAGLHALRRHVVGGADRFRADDRDRPRPDRHRLVRRRPGRRRGQGVRVRGHRRQVPVLPHGRREGVGVLLRGGHHHDAGLHPAAGRVPARHVVGERRDGRPRRRSSAAPCTSCSP